MKGTAVSEHLGKSGRHRILLVNDDGIHSEGLELLAEIASEFTDDVWIVAPDEEKSGASHAISLSVPLRVRQLGDKKFAVKGTPADCVLLAVWELMADSPPTVVISGINHGENLGDDMAYSGTTGAAMESAILGFRSIALSQVRTLGQVPRLDAAKRHGAGVLGKLLECPWETGIVVNVNFPDVPPDEVKGVRLTKLGSRLPGTFRPIAGKDGRNVPYYWVKVSYDPGEIVPGTDLAAIKDRSISITALQIDMTSTAFTAGLRTLFPSDEPISA
jgi:5'-nucleotidase